MDGGDNSRRRVRVGDADAKRPVAIARLSQHVNRPVAWSDLRHDRERRIALAFFWQGWNAGACFEREQATQLRSLPEELQPFVSPC